MPNDIILLTDYHGHFGTKYKTIPYRCGMDKSLLADAFKKLDFNALFMPVAETDAGNKKFKNSYVAYTSSENRGNNYKTYIEDVIYALELAGAKTIPPYRFLKAHNNKVFMEQLRNVVLGNTTGIYSRHFGTLEELVRLSDNLEYPCVLKSAGGSLSSGVFLAKNPQELVRKTSKMSRTPHLRYEIKDHLRKYKHKGYKPESRHQGKGVVQNFVAGLPDDWKILVFGDKVYTLNRKTRDNDFRASGSGKLSYRRDVPERMIDFAYEIYRKFNVPFISLDVAEKNSEFYLIEFQAIFFGTYTLDYSPFYWKKESGKWSLTEEKSILETVYAESIADYINRNSL